MVLAVLPHALMSAMPYVRTAVMYLLLVSALFAWRELSLGKLRLLSHLEILAGLVIAVAGIGTFVLGGPLDKWMFHNNLLAVFTLVVLVPVALVPRFSKFLVMPNHRILAAGTLIFALEAVYTNLSSVLHYRVLPLVNSVGFAALLSSLGYVARRSCLRTNAVCFPSRQNWRLPGRYSLQFFQQAFPKFITCVLQLRTNQ